MGLKWECSSQAVGIIILSSGPMKQNTEAYIVGCRGVVQLGGLFPGYTLEVPPRLSLVRLFYSPKVPLKLKIKNTCLILLSHFILSQFAQMCHAVAKCHGQLLHDNKVLFPTKKQKFQKDGLNRDLNPGPPAPKAGIIPLDH